MTIHVTPIPSTIVLVEPAFSLGLANAAGSATTAVASNSTLLAFDTTVPTTIAYGATAATGSVNLPSRRDHTHGNVADPASGLAKGWGQHNSAGTLQSPSFNCSVSNAGAGEYTITWLTDFDSDVYSFQYTPRSAAYRATFQGMAAGSITGRTWNTSDATTNSEANFAAFGDQ